MLQAPERADDEQHAGDMGIPDPTGVPPLCDEEEFTQLVKEVVAHDAPRMFAVVAEYGDRVDAGCVAWGLAFEGDAFAITADCRRQFVVTSPEDVLPYFWVKDRVTPRLVWHDPSAASPQATDE